MSQTDKMLRIAVIQRFLPSRSRGGVGYFTHGLCNTLVRRGHAVTVFSHDPAPEDALYDVRLLPDPGYVAKYSSAPLAFPFQVAKEDFSNFDVIHAQGDEHLISRLKAPPIVRTMHGSALAEAIHNGWNLRSPKRFFMHLFFYACEIIADIHADVVAVDSEHTARYYPRVHTVIPNGVDIELFSNHGIGKAKRPTILFVGELNTRKRGSLLIKIFREQLKPYLPDVELWLVCPERVCEDGVRWFNMMDSNKLAKLYQEAWVLCLPSSYEGFGRPYIEAMAAGTPVVATRNPGAKEVLDNGRYGFIVSDDKLGETLMMLLSNEAMRQEYSKRGDERVKLYAWEKVAKQYEQIYEAALRKQKSFR